MVTVLALSFERPCAQSNGRAGSAAERKLMNITISELLERRKNLTMKILRLCAGERVDVAFSALMMAAFTLAGFRFGEDFQTLIKPQLDALSDAINSEFGKNGSVN
jgi:hypothetical protein